MVERPIDLRTDRAHTARMYDYLLGGKDNYEADRAAVADVQKFWPSVAVAAKANRAFMHRAVQFLATEGIRQFLDIGTGIPTQPNLHQLAQEIAPESRIVYVDNDPIVLAHARALLTSSPEGRTAYIAADVTTPENILDAAELLDTLDLSQPTALSLIALLHFVPDEFNAYGIVRRLVEALAPGSYLIIAHATADLDPETIHNVEETYRSRGIPAQARSRDEFARFFEGLELVEPGIALTHRWRPAIEPPRTLDPQVSWYAAVARKN